MSAPRPFADPYVAGVGLGLVLLAAFVVAGRGLGASGAFGRVAAVGVAAVAPEHAAARAPLAGYLRTQGPDDPSPLSDWLVVEMAGVLLGGFASALLAGRFRPGVTRSGDVGAGGRLVRAAAGGTAMGVGAMLARGCTSGLALTGGALLAPGAWIFIGTAFGAGYLAAPLVRRSWS